MRHLGIKCQSGMAAEMWLRLHAIGISERLPCFQVREKGRKRIPAGGDKSSIESCRRDALQEALALRGIWIDGPCRAKRANILLRVRLSRCDDRCARNA